MRQIEVLTCVVKYSFRCSHTFSPPDILMIEVFWRIRYRVFTICTQCLLMYRSLSFLINLWAFCASYCTFSHPLWSLVFSMVLTSSFFHFNHCLVRDPRRLFFFSSWEIFLLKLLVKLLDLLTKIHQAFSSQLNSSVSNWLPTEIP